MLNSPRSTPETESADSPHVQFRSEGCLTSSPPMSCAISERSQDSTGNSFPLVSHPLCSHQKRLFAHIRVIPTLSHQACRTHRHCQLAKSSQWPPRSISLSPKCAESGKQRQTEHAITVFFGRINSGWGFTTNGPIPWPILEIPE
jgi:hypothetical protein